jgi:hypothetical protein
MISTIGSATSPKVKERMERICIEDAIEVVVHGLNIQLLGVVTLLTIT